MSDVARIASCLCLVAACGSKAKPQDRAPTPSAAVVAALPAASDDAALSSQAGPTAPRAPAELLAANQSPPVPEGDLPLYEIDESIDDAAGTFSAKAHIVYKNTTREPMRSVPLVLYANAATELGAPSGSSLDVTRASLDGGGPLVVVRERPTLVKLELPKAVPPGETVGFTVDYAGKLRALGPDTNDMFSQAMASLGSLTGSGASDYGLLANGDGILTFACAYPAIAPYRDGQFDTGPPAKNGDLSYNGVARFKVRTVIPAGMSIVTNLVDGPPVPSGTNVAIESEGSFVRDFVLVAGRDLERASGKVGDVTVESVYRARDAKGGKDVLGAATAALASYEKRFGPYPYRKLEVVEASIVGGAGGVEFSGMVLIAGMLYRPPEDSSSSLLTMMKMLGPLGADGSGGSAFPGGSPFAMIDTMREFTVDHEVAHQWFAILLGNDAHRAPSLDEPAAQYLAGLAFEDRHGPAVAKKAMDTNVKMNYAIHRLLGGADGVVNRDTASFRTGIEYAALVYGKAPYVYVALRKDLGEARLHDAMRAAIAQHRFEIISMDQWVSALDIALGGKSQVPRTFHRYFEETHGDEDLGVDASGDFVISTLFPPELAASLRESTEALGMKPADLFRMLLGGAGGATPGLSSGGDPLDVLRHLDPP